MLNAAVYLQNATSIHVWHENLIAFIMSIGKYNVGNTLHKSSSAIAEETRFGTNITTYDNMMFRRTKVVRGDWRMMRHLFSNVVRFSTIRVLVTTSKVFPKNRIVWLLDTLFIQPRLDISFSPCISSTYLGFDMPSWKIIANHGNKSFQGIINWTGTRCTSQLKHLQVWINDLLENKLGMWHKVSNTLKHTAWFQHKSWQGYSMLSETRWVSFTLESRKEEKHNVPSPCL